MKHCRCAVIHCTCAVMGTRESQDMLMSGICRDMWGGAATAEVNSTTRTGVASEREMTQFVMGIRMGVHVR